MSIPKYSICLVARNEAKCLPRLMKSLEPFLARGGDVVLVDTGSKDGTAQLARDLGCQVTEVGDRFRIQIDQLTAEAVNRRFLVEGEAPLLKVGDSLFDFATARNFSASLAKCDFVSFADADEAFTKLDIDAIDAVIAQGFGQFEYEFIFAHDTFGNPAVGFRQCKFYDRRVIKWTGIIHECLFPVNFPSPEIRRTYLPDSIFKLEHWQNVETDRSGYLRGLALATHRDIRDDRASHYLGRELLWTNRPKSAIQELKRHLTLGGWEAERGQSAIYIGEAYVRLGFETQAIEWWHKAFEIHAGRREPLMKLAWHFFYKKDAQRAACYANAALLISKSDHYANEAGHYENEPHEILYWALLMLGDRPTAKLHFDKALKFRPSHPKYKFEAINFYDYQDKGIDGWMSVQELNWLHDTAKKYGTIAEVGSWKGRSTHALLTGAQQSGNQITAIDHFRGSDGKDLTAYLFQQEGEGIYQAFMHNVAGFKNLEVLRMASLEGAAVCATGDRMFDVVFIDAEHTYEGLKADIQAWLPRATKLICGHDYCDAWQPVMRAVDEAFGKPDGVVDSIWYKFITQDVKAFPVESKPAVKLTLESQVSLADRETLKDWTQRIRDGRNFSFVKFSDGEQIAMLPGLGDQNGGKNVDGSHYSPELGQAIVESYKNILAGSNVFLGHYIPHIVRTDIEKGGDPTCQSILRDYWTYVVPIVPMLETARKVTSGLLLHSRYSYTSELHDFYMTIRDTARTVVYVGPEKLAGVADFLDCRHVVIRECDAFLDRQYVLDELKDLPLNSIVLFSAGMAAKVMIADVVRSSAGNVTAIDVGSAFDSMFLGQTRTDQIPTLECRNLYPEVFEPASVRQDRLAFTLLDDLAFKYRSDKTPRLGHNYTETYARLFGDRRDSVKKVLEIGIGFQETMPVHDYKVGASLFMWRDYMPNAQIFGCDIREDILVNDDRIKSFRCDQGQSGELFAMADHLGGEFDLIVDDGSHITDHQIISAIALVPFLAKGGKYVIEDIKEPHVILDQLRQFGFQCQLFEFNPAAADDRLIVIEKSL